MARVWLMGCVMAVAAHLAAPASGEGNPQAALGLVAEHCTACHEVPGLKPRFAKADVAAPAFQAMADQPALYTRERLTAFLRQPHFPMGQFIFSPSDIDNLVAFIEALRKP